MILNRKPAFIRVGDWILCGGEWRQVTSMKWEGERRCSIRFGGVWGISAGSGCRFITSRGKP